MARRVPSPRIPRKENVHESGAHARIRFYYDGKEYKRSLKTGVEKQAKIVKQRVEDTLMFLEQRRLELPAGADPIHFILSDGKRNGKAIIPRVLLLRDLFAIYQAEFADGAKEKNTGQVKG
jgi:hypothetical protein